MELTVYLIEVSIVRMFLSSGAASYLFNSQSVFHTMSRADVMCWLSVTDRSNFD